MHKRRIWKKIAERLKRRAVRIAHAEAALSILKGASEGYAARGGRVAFIYSLLAAHRAADREGGGSHAVQYISPKVSGLTGIATYKLSVLEGPYEPVPDGLDIPKGWRRGEALVVDRTKRGWFCKQLPSWEVNPSPVAALQFRSLEALTGFLRWWYAET